MLAAVLVVAALLGSAIVAAGPDRSGSSDAARVSVATVTSPSTTPVDAAVRVPTPTTAVTGGANPPSTVAAATTSPTAVDPGTLPQTEERPTASGAEFAADTRGLWDAIVADDPARALSFFFPQTAYVQVKAINDPVGDYQSRLIANYEQDIHALHAQLGADASRAQFTGLSVPGDQAVWVQPGAEYNKGSYWRVYGSTLHYTVDGQDRSFPVSSLISWRGQWYVVHLGEIR